MTIMDAVLAKSFPFRKTFTSFLEEYTACGTYWYVPKTRVVSDKNLQAVRQTLQLIFEEFLDRVWNPAMQDELLDRLIEEKISDPYKEGSLQDRTALSRIIKKLLEVLGLLWIKEGQEIIITDAGLEVILVENPRPIIETQVAKIQYPNPSITAAYRRDFKGLLPHLFLLQLLQQLDYYLTVEEYELFVNLARGQDDLERILRYIECWRNLTEDEQEILLETVQDIPMRETVVEQLYLLEEVIVQENSGATRYGRIRRSSPYQRRLYLYPHYLEENTINSKRSITCTSRDQVDELITEQLKGLKIPTFSTLEDWFAYFGDSEQRPSWYTYLSLTIQEAETQEATKEIVRKYRDELEPQEAEEIDRLQIEKGIETFYVDRLELLEKGLKLVEGGRQYPTPIGRIDLLCRSRNNEYVVVEIKADEATDSVFGQILRYIGWVHCSMKGGRNNVRGIILAGKFLEKARYSRIGLLKDDYKRFLKFKRHKLDVQTI